MKRKDDLTLAEIEAKGKWFRNFYKHCFIFLFILIFINYITSQFLKAILLYLLTVVSSIITVGVIVSGVLMIYGFIQSWRYTSKAREIIALAHSYLIDNDA